MHCRIAAKNTQWKQQYISRTVPDEYIIRFGELVEFISSNCCYHRLRLLDQQ